MTHCSQEARVARRLKFMTNETLGPPGEERSLRPCPTDDAPAALGPPTLLERAAAFGPFDEVIAQLLVAGDVSGAVTALIESHGAAINGIVHAYLCHSPDAPDVFQRFCIRLPKALLSFRWDCPVRQRAITTALSVARSHVRSRAGRARSSHDSALAATVAIDPASFEAGVLRDVHRLACAMRKLDERTRAIVILRGKGYGSREIALMLADDGDALSEDGVAQRYHRAVHRGELREYYEALPPACGTEACTCGHTSPSVAFNATLTPTISLVPHGR